MDADPFPFTANVRMQDAMLYSLKIEPISWPEDVALDSITSFDLLLERFEVVVEADPLLAEEHNEGIKEETLQKVLQ